jgi:spermidine synthase
MTGWVLYVIVCVSGASVLAIEMLGTRILGPFYGVSVFLWSALIAVTLAALSLGYAAGGRWADRGPRLSRLGVLMVAAGAWVLLVPWLKHPVLRLIEPLGLRAAVLVAACVLFAPPLTFLGMVSPYAIRLKASHLDHVGRTAGNLYAVSTVASVVAALLTGFYLIPNFGVSKLLLLLGIAQVAAGAVALASAGSRRAAAGLAVLLVPIAGLAVSKTPSHTAAPELGLIEVEQSPYAEIRVIDQDGARALVIDGAIHTLVAADTGAPLHRYAAALGACKLLFDAPGRLLLIGLGGGSVVKSYARDGWTIDAVEIDPAVARIAHAWFGLTDDEAHVHLEDGRRFLRTSSATYDLIILDAFGSSSIPFHLATREAFGLMAARLGSNGVLAINVDAQGWDDVLVRSLAATLRLHFRTVWALPTSEPPNTLGNVILLAANRELEIPDAQLPNPVVYLPYPDAHFAVVQLNHAWNNRFEPEAGGARVVTDELNPVDVWAERINRAGRRDLHRYWRHAGLGW